MSISEFIDSLLFWSAQAFILGGLYAVLSLIGAGQQAGSF